MSIPQIFHDTTRYPYIFHETVETMIYVDILEYLHGQQRFENVLEDVLEDVFGLAPPGPRLMVAMGHMLWSIQWAVHEY